MTASYLSRQIENRNFLSPTGFKFILNRAPKVAFFSNSANIPSLELGSAVQTTYLKDLDIPGDKIVFEDFSKAINKTKEMFKILNKHEATNSIFVLDKNSQDKVGKSLKNLPNVKVTNTENIVLYDLLKYKKLIFTETSIKDLEKRFI